MERRQAEFGGNTRTENTQQKQELGSWRHEWTTWVNTQASVQPLPEAELGAVLASMIYLTTGMLSWYNQYDACLPACLLGCYPFSVEGACCNSIWYDDTVEALKALTDQTALTHLTDLK